MSSTYFGVLGSTSRDHIPTRVYVEIGRYVDMLESMKFVSTQQRRPHFFPEACFDFPKCLITMSNDNSNCPLVEDSLDSNWHF